MLETTTRLRPATLDDVAAINAIYNHYVRHTTATYQVTEESAADRAAWLTQHGPEHPVIVALDPEGTVVGWGSLSAFHKREAFQRTVENSIYLSPEHQRRGIGGLILADLITRARALGHRTIIAAISSEQAPSVALHRKFGFEETGRLRRVGEKFGRTLDIIYLQRWLDEP
jgi:L-amino acid N-acyltransferase